MSLSSSASAVTQGGGCLFSVSCFALTCRLEGLAGLSVQDAELKLFAEKTAADAPAGGAHESSSPSTRSNVGGDAPRDTTAAAPAASDEGGKKKKKKKRAKKQPAVTQRGPLLITHTGEMHVYSRDFVSVLRWGIVRVRIPVRRPLMPTVSSGSTILEARSWARSLSSAAVWRLWMVPGVHPETVPKLFLFTCHCSFLLAGCVRLLATSTHCPCYRSI